MTEVSEVALDAAALRSWMRASQDALGHRRAEIDALNVFPVPDGDTGTNMYLTIEAAAIAAVEVSDPASTPGPTADALARGQPVADLDGLTGRLTLMSDGVVAREMLPRIAAIRGASHHASHEIPVAEKR